MLAERMGQLATESLVLVGQLPVAFQCLAAALEDLHWSTRKPKHVLMAALVAVALDRLDDVRRQVSE
ncbi:hypothetical protein [Actinacidiphila oryziradicis]|uniref:hypothetical protein n=1 Tax=Actinacidiphila oryziradicis TaxID=2571141 RepID=UPI00145F52C5|nr:hypothetical protein [Actinacidiphila oryziradicis]